MIRDPVTLVIGAGASASFGFPLGRELLAKIVKTCSTNTSGHLLNERQNAGAGYLRHMRDFSEDLKLSGMTSIDAFLQRRPEYVDVGKEAIAWMLTRCENPRRVFNTSTPMHWLQWLWQLMIEPPDRFHLNNVAFIVLNYDRTIEHYFHTGMMKAYGLSSEEAAEAISQTPIIHLHGQLGDLPWQSRGGRAYEIDSSDRGVGIAAEGIHVIHETSESAEAYEEARALLDVNVKAFFLGCGFHADVMDRLPLGDRRNSVNLGTTMGLGGAASSSVQRRWHVRGWDTNCLEFLKEHFRVF